MNAPRFSRRYWLNLSSALLVMVVVGYFAYVYLGVSYFMAKGFTEPQRLPLCCKTPADEGLIYEDVELTTQDGVTIRGWYIPSQNRGAVILIHPMASNRLGTLDLAAMFAKHSYGVMMIDLRVHGESGGELLTFGGGVCGVGSRFFPRRRLDSVRSTVICPRAAWIRLCIPLHPCGICGVADG